MKRENVALIGVGGIGCRHLQALMLADYEIDIFAVEKNPDTREKLRSEFFPVRENLSLTVCEKIEDLPVDIAVAIIATASDVRREVFEELLAHAKVKFAILEKVLFQKAEDYAFVKNLIEENKMKVWVNCPRREMPAYQALKARMKSCGAFTVNVTGGSWGLGCNGIHMLDLVSYLSDSGLCTVDTSKVIPRMYRSKRKGFSEFHGAIRGDCGNCISYEFTSFDEALTPTVIMISAARMQVVIDESLQIMFMSAEEDQWKWKQQKFEILYQSNLTHRTVEKILKTGTCGLPDYAVSMKLHLAMISGLSDICRACGEEGTLCPIT